MPYDVYAPVGFDVSSVADGSSVRVVTMDIAFSQMPDAVWLMKMLPKASVGFRSNSREIQARLCAEGARIAVLPRPLGDATPESRRSILARRLPAAIPSSGLAN